MIPPSYLTELKALFKEDGMDITDDAALEVAQWLMARAISVPDRIPAAKKDLWDKIVSEAHHPHGFSHPATFTNRTRGE